MANLREIVFEITDKFTFDYKNEFWIYGLDETPTDIWILNKKKEALLSMKQVVKSMDKEVRELENKYYRKLDERV
jgi:hypothetical protein